MTLTFISATRAALYLGQFCIESSDSWNVQRDIEANADPKGGKEWSDNRPRYDIAVLGVGRRDSRFAHRCHKFGTIGIESINIRL
jgi:hypothetical protein